MGFCCLHIPSATTDIARREVPDVLLVIAGEGPAEKGLQQLTEDLRLEQNVKFIGYSYTKNKKSPTGFLSGILKKLYT